MVIRNFVLAAGTLRRPESLPFVRVSELGDISMDPEKLQERLQQAKARAQRWKGESTRLEGIQRGEDRRRQTRKKIWVGGWLLKAIAEDAMLRQKLLEHLRTVKFRKGEREMFVDLLGTE